MIGAIRSLWKSDMLFLRVIASNSFFHHAFPLFMPKQKSKSLFIALLALCIKQQKQEEQEWITLITLLKDQQEQFPHVTLCKKSEKSDWLFKDSDSFFPCQKTINSHKKPIRKFPTLSLIYNVLPSSHSWKLFFWVF